MLKNNRPHQRNGADKTMPNETETVEQPSQPFHIDISFDVDEGDITRPVLKAGTYDFTIGFTRNEPSRKQGKPQLLVGYRLAQIAEDTRGRPISPGFTITQRILLVPSGKYTEELRDQRLKQIQFATHGKSRFNGDPTVWVGKPCRVQITVREPHTDDLGQAFGESNEIGRVMAPTK